LFYLQKITVLIDKPLTNYSLIIYYIYVTRATQSKAEAMIVQPMGKERNDLAFRV